MSYLTKEKSELDQIESKLIKLKAEYEKKKLRINVSHLQLIENACKLIEAIDNNENDDE